MATGQFVTTQTIPAGAVGNTQISNQLTDRLDYTKLQPTFFPESNFGLASTGTPVTRTEQKYTGKLAGGTILGFHAYLINTGSGSSMTFDLQKNGSTVLSAPITITNATSSGAVQNATISSASFTQGDIFTYVLTVSSSTGAQGPVCWATFVEASAPTS